MKEKYYSSGGFIRSLISAIALVAIVTSVNTGTAQALSYSAAQNAVIMNVVKVEYKDATGLGSFTKSADVTVTVQLKQASPSIYFAVANGVTGSTTSSQGPNTINSGATQDYSFWLYSNSNGSDTYNFTVGNGASPDSNFVAGTPKKYITSYTDPTGTATPVGGNSTMTLSSKTVGATTIIGNTGDTVNVAYNTLNGISNNDYVVIVNAGVPTMYKVRLNNNGVAPSHTGDALVNETNGTIQLWNADGTTSPSFTANALTGLVISQVWKVTTQVTAVADDTASADADIYLKADLATTVNGGTYDNNKDNIKTTFKRSQLTIVKSASPLTPKPGDTVTYTITVWAKGADATSVKVTDAVPVYTTLVDNPFGVLAGTFAQVSVAPDGSSPVYGTTLGTDLANLTKLNTDTEYGNIASGDAAGTVAGSALTFYLGQGNVGTGAPLGGTISTPKVYRIQYKVTVN